MCNAPKLDMLQKCLALTGTAQADYFRLLATRVFFFTTEAASSGFRSALLRAGPVDVLTVDTYALLRAHEDCVEVSRHNSGSPPRAPIAKGRETWQPLDAFDGRASQIQEVTVLDRVDDIESLTVSVVRLNGDGTLRPLWP